MAATGGGMAVGMVAGMAVGMAAGMAGLGCPSGPIGTHTGCRMPTPMPIRQSSLRPLPRSLFNPLPRRRGRHLRRRPPGTIVRIRRATTPMCNSALGVGARLPRRHPSTTSLDPPGAEMGNLVGRDEPQRSCTWPLRVNTSDSPVDRYRDKQVRTRGLSWHPSGPLPPG
jgi:hypothetical protein